jgi:hypothetical protein
MQHPAFSYTEPSAIYLHGRTDPVRAAARPQVHARGGLRLQRAPSTTRTGRPGARLQEPQPCARWLRPPSHSTVLLLAAGGPSACRSQSATHPGPPAASASPSSSSSGAAAAERPPRAPPPAAMPAPRLGTSLAGLRFREGRGGGGRGRGRRDQRGAAPPAPSSEPGSTAAAGIQPHAHRAPSSAAPGPQRRAAHPPTHPPTHPPGQLLIYDAAPLSPPALRGVQLVQGVAREVGLALVQPEGRGARLDDLRRGVASAWGSACG